MSSPGAGRRRAVLAAVWLSAVGLASWGLFRAGALPATAAARTGTGVGAAVVSFLVLRSSWPPDRRRESFERLLVAAPVEPVARPPQLLEIELAMRLATFTSGRADAELRLRPLVQEAVRYRLRAHRGIDLTSMPEQARAAMGERLWGLVGAGVPSAVRDGPGLSPAEVEALVQDVSAL